MKSARNPNMRRATKNNGRHKNQNGAAARNLLYKNLAVGFLALLLAVIFFIITYTRLKMGAGAGG